MVSVRASIRLVLITVLLALSGCASFREGTSQAPVSWPITNVPAKQSISLLMTHETITNGWRISVPQTQVQKVEESVVRAYKDSGLFSDVKIGAADTRQPIGQHRRRDAAHAAVRIDTNVAAARQVVGAHQAFGQDRIEIARAAILADGINC